MSQKMHCFFLMMIVIVLTAGGVAIAQQPPAPPVPPAPGASPAPIAARKHVNFYRLDFVLRELDEGKVVNTRNYSMWLKSDGIWGTLRAGNDIPVPAIPTREKAAELTYRKTGFQMDCALDEIDDNPVVSINGSMSAILPGEPHDPKPAFPVIQTFTFKAAALLSPDKPMLVSSIDDPISKRRFQLEVTAAKLK